MMSIIRAATAGTDTSGDALVSVSPASEGLHLQISSVFYAQFSRSIEKTARELLAVLGVQNAEVAIDDHGAMDWVLRARIEAAVLRGREAE